MWGELGSQRAHWQYQAHMFIITPAWDWFPRIQGNHIQATVANYMDIHSNTEFGLWDRKQALPTQVDCSEE